MHHWSAIPWLPFLGFQLRRTENRFNSCARRGQTSVNFTPGTAVSMTPNGPFTLSAASGLGSSVS
jgi:hypothetical protein